MNEFCIYKKDNNMTPKEFSEFVYKDLDEDYGICPPPIDPQVGLDIVIEHF